MRRRRVRQQRAARGDRQRHVLAVIAIKGDDTELLRERSATVVAAEMPRRERAHRSQRVERHTLAHRLRRQHFARLQSLQLGREPRRAYLRERDASGCEIQRRDADLLSVESERDEQVVLPCVEETGFGQCARRDDPDDLSFHRALGRRDVAHLLADRNGLAQLDQLLQILVDCVIGNAGHRDRRAVRLTASGQRDVEQLRRALRVVEEEFVEIAHPVEEEGVRVVGLDAKILLHHWAVRRL